MTHLRDQRVTGGVSQLRDGGDLEKWLVKLVD
jgi:hypothetical protein